MKSNIKKITALCICILSAFTVFAETEWGKGAGRLSDWQFVCYKDIKSSATEFSGKTICVVGVKSPFLYSPDFDWDASPNDVLAIEIKSSRAGSGHMHFKHSSKDGYVDELRERLNTPGGDGKWHLMLVPLKNSDWKGKISNIRLGMLYEDGVDIAIRRVKLIRTQDIVGNLLKNGGFEMPALDAMPFGWSVNGDGVSASTAACDGGSMLQFSGKGTATLTQPPAYIDFLEPASAALTVSLKAQATAAGTLAATVLIQDALRKEIATKTQTWQIAPQQSTAVLKIPEWEIPLETARAVFSLEWKCAEEATLSLDDVCLLQRQAPKPQTWTGEWIRPGDKPDTPPRDMFLRKSFDLPQGAKNVWLLCNCDDYINNVFVNGRQLPPMPNAKAYNAADSIRIDDFVKPGRNVVAVHGYNFNILGGVICDIAFTTPAGWSRIGTDASWASSSDKQEDWMKPQFDDSKWSRPITMGKGAGTPFGVLDAPKVMEEEDIALRDFTATAKSASQSSVSIDYSISIERPADNNGTSLALILFNNPNYPEKRLPPTGFKLATIPFKHGETRVQGTIAYPDFLPSGRFMLRVESAKGSIKPAEAAITVPGFLTPPRPAKLSFTAEYAPYLKWGDTPLEIIHHWCGSDGQITEERLGNARDIQIPFYIGNHYRQWGWRPNGKYDFSPIDNYIYRILELDPNARCSMQIAVDNYHNKELQEWLDAHPTECAMREDGTTLMRQIHSGKNVRVVSHASRLWREEMRRSLTALSSHLRKMPFGQRAISIQPTSGMGGEWCMWGTFSTGGGVERLDYSRPFRQYFADFAVKKYGSIEKMNAAWGTEFVTPEDIRLPSSQERDRNDWFEFLDARKSRRIIDYRQSISELIADDVITMCEAIKTGSDNQMYAGTFYGYTTYVASGMPNRTEGGHFALGKVLNSPHVDYLTHLLRYADRIAGSPAGFMTPESSLLLHGKVPFVQADIRTHRLPPEAPEAVYGRLNNLQEGIAVIQRDFSNAVMNGVGYEFGYYGNGWIAADKRMMQTIGRCREIERLAREKWKTKRIDTENSIAVIVDDISTYYSAQSSNIHQFSLLYQIPEFYHTGVGLDTYLLEDLPLMPKYKCYVFLNTFHLTPAQQDFIQKNLKRDGNVLAFIYAQGVATDDGIKPSKVQEVTGIKMDVLDKAVKTEIKYIENSIPAGKYLPVGKTFGLKTTHGPVFIPREGTVLANMTDGGTPALVVKGFDDHTVCYTSILQISSDMLKGLAELAGITVINQNKHDCTYVSDNMFAVHTANGGHRTFQVPPKYTQKATELFTGKEFKIQNGAFDYDMEPISTSLFLME